MSSDSSRPTGPTRKPRGLRWAEAPDGRGGVLRAPWSVPILCTLASLWNFTLPTLTRRHGSFDAFTLIGIAAGLLFGYFALRGFFDTTRIHFAGGKLTVVTGPLGRRARLDHDIRDIHGFVAEPDDVKEGHGHVVSVVTRAGARLPLPLRLNGITLTMRGAATPFMGVAPREHAAYVAQRLDEVFDAVRREGGEYRVAPGQGDVPHDRETADGSDEEREERGRLRDRH